VADRHSGVFIGVAGVAVVAGGVLISIGVAEVSNTTKALSSNGWFDLGVALVIFGVVLAAIGAVLHFRREVDGSSAPAVVDTAPVGALPATPPPAAPAINQAEWEALCNPSGPVMAFQLHRRFGDRGAYRDFNAFRCIVTDPDGITTEADGLGIIRQYPAEFPEAPAVRQGTYRSEWKGRASDGSWVDITSGECEVKAPPKLIVTILEDSRFENFRRLALIAILHVQVENTSDAPIEVTGYPNEVDGTPNWGTLLARDERTSVTGEAFRREEDQQYGQPLRMFRRIAPHQVISGWYLIPVHLPPGGGTPVVTVIARDGADNEYRSALFTAGGSEVDPSGTASG
jgi:hypothetical protein